jgi:ABC-type microcin C transport system permease subunit YejB
MQAYLARRLLTLIPALFFASLIVFVIVRLVPGKTLAFVQEASDEPNRDEKPILVAELVDLVLQSNLPKPKDRLFEDEELQNRLSEFKAIQYRFEREREEFFKKTMSKVRSPLPRNDV